MAKPFDHDGRTYTFQRSGSEYVIERDDGLTAWDVYPTVGHLWPDVMGPAPAYHAYRPAFATVEECKQAIRGERPPTYYHRLVFAASAYQTAPEREGKRTMATPQTSETRYTPMNEPTYDDRLANLAVRTHQLETELAALRPWAEIGKWIVWHSAWDDEREDGSIICHRCGNDYVSEGHAPDCPIPALLAQLEAEDAAA